MKSQPVKPDRCLNRASRRAFTLVELLVATTVTLILLTVCGMAMQSTSQTAEVTIANQDVSGYAASLANTLRDDFRRIRSDTCMVIKTQSVAPFSSLAPNSEQYTTDRYNIDQIMFFANGPWTSQKFIAGGPNPLKRDVQADLARVWYGHLAGNTGVPPAAASGVAYQPQFDVNGGLIPQVDWTLGRHALLLPNKLSTDSECVGAPTNIWYNDSTTAGIVTGLWDVVGDSAAGVFHNNSFNDILTQAGQGTFPPGYEGTLLPYPRTNSRAPGWFGGGAQLDQYEMLSEACSRVYGARFMQNAATLANLRNTTQLTTNVVVPFCSDFKVEFAGDFTSPATPGVPDGRIDMESTAAPGMGDPTGDDVTPFNLPVYWYGGVNNSAHTGSNKAERRRYVQPNTNTATGYGGEDTNASTAHPVNFYLYPDTTILGGPENLGSKYQAYTAVFGPDHSLTPWPKLVRITVVLQDEHGRFHQRYVKSKPSPASSSTTATMPDGKTYQFILEVP